MSFLRRLLPLFALLCLLVGGTAMSGATFTSTSINAGNSFSGAADWVAPTVTLVDPGTPLRGTVTLNATATDLLGSGVASVAFQARSSSSTGSWTTLCTDTTLPYSCAADTTTLPDGTYDLRAVATDNGDNTATSTVSNRVVDNAPFSVTLADPGDNLSGSVPLSATVSSGGSLVTSVRFQIRTSGTTAWSDVCTDATAPYGCSLDTTKYAADLYDFRAVATNAVGTTVTSAEFLDVQLDNVAPTVSLANPGSPLRGVVTLSATAADADSGVNTVVFQRAPAGGSTWTTVCTSTVDPYTCRFDTTAISDGSYDLRAIATDYAGNTKTSTIVSARTVDNSVATVSLDDPGAFLRGTITLTATPNASGGVTSTTIRYRATGASTWTTICTKTASPWTCSLDTTTVADGSYEFSATMVAKSGATATSSTITGRKVDNSNMRGVDVQADNKTGGALGKPEAGDVLTLSWSEAPKPSSLIAGWDGTSATTITVRLRDGGLVGTGGSADGIDFLTSGGSSIAALGSINLRGNYIKSNKTVTFPGSSVTLSGSSLRIVLGTASGGVRTWGTPTNMVWTPSSAATDLAGNPTSTAPVTETGTLDKDF